MTDTIMARDYKAEMARVWEGDLTPLEQRAELDSLEDLHVQRRQLLPEYAVLRALHGPSGKWDARRKAMLSAIKVAIRIDAATRQEKMTEAAIDDAAHADAQYLSVVDQGIVGHTRYIELDTQVSELQERIDNRTSSMYAYGKEAGLGR